jgi:hypothetical protein
MPVCIHCGKPVDSGRPAHLMCAWHAGKLALQSGVAPGQARCDKRNCDNVASTYSLLGGNWYRLCLAHRHDGYTLGRSLQHTGELLAGRDPRAT